MKYIKFFNTHSEYNTYINGQNAIFSNVSYCKDNNEVHYNPKTYERTYLTFTALENCKFKFLYNYFIHYSLDNGKTWIEIEGNTETPTVTSGSSIMWKGSLIPFSSTGGIGTFMSTGNFEVKGNIMSLLYDDDFLNKNTLSDDYMNYFNGLFSGVTTLILADKLSLPATTLVFGCYSNMFKGCTGLTTAPKLPSTTLEFGCYSNMFENCTSLTTAPELPATTLVNNCYYGMFKGCTSLNYIKAMFTTNINDDMYTGRWVENVSATGTFVKNSAAEWNVTGDNGIPSGWTVQTASE